MFKNYFLLIGFLLLLFCPYCLGQSVKSDSLYSLGVALFDEGKYDKAILYFKDSYTLDCAEMDSLSPRRNYSADWLAYCYYKTGNIDEAKKYNKVCYKSKPIDRRLTTKIDSLSVEANKDFMNRLFFSALKKANEVDILESPICDDNSFFHVGTYQIKANCYVAIQKLDSALFYLQKVRGIEKVYFEKYDTLSIGTINGLFYLNLNLHQYDTAKMYNEELTDIFIHNFDSNHILNAETNYQKIMLHLYKREWGKAHDALPAYIDILKHCFGNNPEAFKRTMLTIRGDFEMCGRYDDVKYIDIQNVVTAKNLNVRHHFDSLILQYMSLLDSKDSLRVEDVEKEIIYLLSEYPEDSLKEQRAVLPCLQSIRYFAKGNFYEAQNVFLKIQEDSLEQYLNEYSEYYLPYLATKGFICVSLDDFEEGISAFTKFLGRMDAFQQRQYPNILAQVACLHAMAGHYQKARELANKAIRDYKQYIVDMGASYRLYVDTMRIGQIAALVQTYINNSAVLPDSAVYMLREIRSDYLLLKVDLMKNTRRYQIDSDYYECISDLAFELTKMGKYIEAQEVMDNYLSEWHNCYDAIDANSQDENDVFDRVLGPMALESALDFRRRKCYEKSDPLGIKAHNDYIRYVKKEYGEKSDKHLNAMINYFEFIGDNKSLLSYLSSAIDADPEKYYPYAYKLVADAYAEEKQLELSMKYRKAYIKTSLRDTTARNDKEYEILSAISAINKYYVREKKDTLSLLRYYCDELWPLFDICKEAYLSYFIRSVDKLCYEIDDDSFVPLMEKEMKKNPNLFESPIIRGCVNQVIAGVLSRGKKKDLAFNYLNRALQTTKNDTTLQLLFACQMHDLMVRCAQDSVDIAILLGDDLIKKMAQKPEWKFSHEYANLVKRQIDLLQKSKRYEELIGLCQNYLVDFSDKNSEDVSHILNSQHPIYEKIEFLNHVTLYSWSSDLTIPTVHKALYSSLSIINPYSVGDYALGLVHDQYNNIESSLKWNTVRTWQCDDIISLTSKLAYKHKTDSLKIYAYDTSLLCKGLQLRSSHAIRAIIQKSGHKSALRKYDELQYTLRLLTSAPEEKIDSILKRRKDLENDLFRLSKYFGDYQKSLYMSWKDIQGALNDDDIAIEYTFVEKDYDDIYVRNDSTLHEGYYACIIKKGMACPDIIFVAETDSLGSSPEVYSNAIMTHRLLSPLKQYLEGVKNIYYSPIGVLNQISIESLPLEEGSNLNISNVYNVYRLSSTREIVEYGNQIIGKDAVVYGGLTYNTSIDYMTKDAQNYLKINTRNIDDTSNVNIIGIRDVIADIPYLIGTKIEAENVTLTINNAKDTLFNAQAFIGSKGTEASFKSMGGKRKRVIHIATHGFYLNKDDYENNIIDRGKTNHNLREEDKSLQRSGLFFSGAEHKYQGEFIPEGIEDGILTAQEIANTDLSGLDLCVLSACKTAQGDITSEGVFGLQRGFKKAGANSILMSLWKVDDEATCLLMTEFYKNWIGEGKTKHDALETAKQAVRSHREKGWDNPKYWAAFILLDGLD